MASLPHKPVLIAGPTASGKSGLALRIAERTGAAIVNADALQVYACWRILSARPTDAEMARAEHLLYGHVPCETSYSVGAWLREVAAIVEMGRSLIIVGGTGLYLTSLTRGLAEIPATPAAIRAEGDRRRAQAGASAFLDYLARHDPRLYARIDRNNAMRLQRAWEVHRATGKALSAWQENTASPLIDLGNAVPLRLDCKPAWVNERIAARFTMMMADGALAEVEAQRAQWDPSRPSARVLGAAELMACLDRRMTRDEAVDRAITATRQFAKRQRTWLRSNMRNWIGLDAAEATSDATVNRVISMM